MEKIKILIVDDHGLIRQGLKRILEMDKNLKVIGEASTAEEALILIKNDSPKIILMDINMPGISGIEAIKRIKKEGLESEVILLTIHDEPEYLYEGLRAGAMGFVLKDIEPDNLIQAVKSVAKGESYIQPNMTKDLVAEFKNLSKPPLNSKDEKINRLSTREREVLSEITEGLSNSEIAAKLSVSEKTVKNHVSSVLKKLEVLDRTQAAIYAIKNA